MEENRPKNANSIETRYRKFEPKAGFPDFQNSNLNLPDQDSIRHKERPKNNDPQRASLPLEPAKKSMPKNFRPPNESLYFESLKKCLLKLFLGRPLEKIQMPLEPHEDQLLRCILLKKKLPIEKSRVIDTEYLAELATHENKKKREYELKFVLVKCIKFMRQRLQSTQNRFAVIKESDHFMHYKDYQFYRHFFGDIARREGLPIEKFFYFKNWTHRFNKNIPKTITLESLSLWKKSPRFISAIKDHLDREFMPEFHVFNQKKIEVLVGKWNRIVEEKGLSRGVAMILISLTGRGAKLPWTMAEVKRAVRNTIEALD